VTHKKPLELKVLENDQFIPQCSCADWNGFLHANPTHSAKTPTRSTQIHEDIWPVSSFWVASTSQVSNTRPAGRMRPTTSYYAAPDGSTDTRSPLYPVLIFWRFQMKWIFVIILEKWSCVKYFYCRINNHKMQRELFNNMFGSSLYRASVTPAL